MLLFYIFQIYEGETPVKEALIGSICDGNQIIRNYTSKGNNLLVEFKSDNREASKGFKAVYNMVNINTYVPIFFYPMIPFISIKYIVYLVNDRWLSWQRVWFSPRHREFNSLFGLVLHYDTPNILRLHGSSTIFANIVWLFATWECFLIFSSYFKNLCKYCFQIKMTMLKNNKQETV